jgi:hypothetical protein
MLIPTFTVLLLVTSPVFAQTSNAPTGPSNLPSQGDSRPPKAPVGSASEAQASEESHRTLRVGLTVGLISIPRPISVEVQVKLWDWFGVGASYNYLPGFVSDLLLNAYDIHNVTVTSTSWELALRAYPFRGSFYLGTNIGVGSVTASTTGNLQAARADVTNPFITPRLGWLWIFGSGFTLGFDLGVQIPLGKSAITFEPPQVDIKETRDAANQIGESLLPVLNFRVGYFL